MDDRKHYDELTPEQKAQANAIFQEPWAGDPQDYVYEIGWTGMVLSRRLAHNPHKEQR